MVRDTGGHGDGREGGGDDAHTVERRHGGDEDITYCREP